MQLQSGISIVALDEEWAVGGKGNVSLMGEARSHLLTLTP